MKICALSCAAMIAAAPASAQQLMIELLPGHPVYHEREQEAGVTMALSIIPDHDRTSNSMELCEELRVAAGLDSENGDKLRLETIFVAPHTGMTVEGYYLPGDGTFGKNALVRGKGVSRDTLDTIVTRAGFPARLLDETNVKHEISCETGEPLWHLVWYDVRPVGDEKPDALIERAYDRFMAVHQSVVEHNAKARYVQKVKRPSLPEAARTTGG